MHVPLLALNPGDASDPPHVCQRVFLGLIQIWLLLARLIGQYCFARWRLSASVVYRRL